MWWVIPASKVDINMLHTSNTASIKLNSNVVAEFPRSKKLIKYPRVALTCLTGGYSVRPKYVLFNNYGWYAFNGDPGILAYNIWFITLDTVCGNLCRFCRTYAGIKVIGLL